MSTLHYLSLTHNNSTLYEYFDSIQSSSAQNALSEIARSVIASVDDSVPMGIVPGPNNSSYYIKYKENGSTIVIVTICSSEIRKEYPFIAMDRVLKSYLEHLSTYNDDNSNNTKSDFKEKFFQLVESEQQRISAVPEDSLTKANGEDDAGEFQVHFLNQELNQVKQIMKTNLESLVDRHERLDSLVAKTDRINTNSQAFKRRSVQLHRRMWWSNIKLRAIIASVVIILIYFSIGAVCGLPGYGRCFT